MLGALVCTTVAAADGMRHSSLSYAGITGPGRFYQAECAITIVVVHKQWTEESFPFPELDMQSFQV